MHAFIEFGDADAFNGSATVRALEVAQPAAAQCFAGKVSAHGEILFVVAWVVTV